MINCSMNRSVKCLKARTESQFQNGESSFDLKMQFWRFIERFINFRRFASRFVFPIAVSFSFSVQYFVMHLRFRIVESIFGLRLWNAYSVKDLVPTLGFQNFVQLSRLRFVILIRNIYQTMHFTMYNQILFFRFKFNSYILIA